MYSRALKLIRQYHRLSQVELAKKLRLSKSFISEIETGNKTPSVEVLEQYAKLFGIPLSSLFLFTERAEEKNFADDARIFAADKILKALEWLEVTSDSKK